MPNVRKGEDKTAFVSRCIGELMGEGSEQGQAVAICYSMWEEDKKKKRKQNA